MLSSRSLGRADRYAGSGWDVLDDDGAQAALHDAAYRYAFRRSLSLRLASSAALEAVGSLGAAPGVAPRSQADPRDHAERVDPGEPSDPTEPTHPRDAGELADPVDGGTSALGADRVAVLRATRNALQRYLPTTLPPRAVGDPTLKAALADLAPADRELLLLHHWDGLPVEDAARMTGSDPRRLVAVETACARAARRVGATAVDVTVGDAKAGQAGIGVPTAPQQKAPALPDASFAAALAAADPAAAITGTDLAGSRGALRSIDGRRSTGLVPPVVGEPPPAGTAAAPAAPASAAAEAASASMPDAPVAPAATTEDVPLVKEDVPPVKEDDPGLSARIGVPRRRTGAIVGTLCLLAVLAGLVTVLIPRATPGPAGDAERLFALADVVAVVSIADLQPTQVDGELRMLQAAAVVQIVKGAAEGTTLTIDVTGRSTLERPFSRNLFTPDRLMFLVRDGDGTLSPLEEDEAVLTLVDRRSPEATTIAGDPAPLPDELRDAIHALPAEELGLDTNGTPPGLVPEEATLGTRPPEDDVENHPRSPLGTFRVLPAGDSRACVVFEYDGRAVLLRWPEGFSAYERTEVLAYPNGDPRRGRKVLTVLNDRGYPFVDDERQAPFISGTPTGERDECGGQELEVWDVAVEPGTTLLTY
ncbi:hypothetical protein [Arthrobacter sp. TMS2-4]